MLSPVAGSPARGPDVERRSPELWASKASGARAQELQGLGERRLHSWRAPLRFHGHWDPGKAVTPQESGPTYLRLWRVSWGGRVSCCSRWGKDTSGRGSREPAASSAGVPPARQPAEWGRRPASQPQAVQSPPERTAPAHTLTWPCPQRGTPRSPQSGQAPASPTGKPAKAPGPA